MEKFEPKKKRSPIESLKFQRKSDYKKFRNFIKKQTEELKGVVAPKQDKFKNLLKVGAGGLGLLSIGGLFGSKLKGKRTGEGSDVFPFAIGRKNYPDSPPPRPPLVTTPKPPTKPLIKPGTRTTSLRNIPKIDKTIRKIKKVKPTEALYAKKGELSKVGEIVEKQKQKIESKPRKSRRSKRSTVSKSIVFDPTDKGIKAEERILKEFKKNQEIQKRVTNKVVKKYIKDSKKLDQFLKQSGSPRRVIRPKRMFNIAKNTQGTRDISSMNPSEMERAFGTSSTEGAGGANTGTNIRDSKPKKDRFTRRSTRPGVDTFSKSNPFKRFNVVDNPMLSKNPYKGGFFSRIFKSKVTRDTIMGIPTKGKYITKAGMFFKHPIVSGVSFLLTAYEAFQDGKSLVPFTKDNIFTRLYDLGVAINNELIHPDYPSKMKLFISESSNDKKRKADIMRNVKILELRKQQAQGAGGGNNVIVVPETKQNNQVSTNVPIKKGADKISFVPFEPVNSVGTDILLHKLNQ